MNQMSKKVALLCTLSAVFGISLMTLENVKNLIVMLPSDAGLYAPLLGVQFRIDVLWDFAMLMLVFTFIFAILLSYNVARQNE